MPVKTSPVPPVAMPGLPVGFTHTVPSGETISVRCPLSTTISLMLACKLPRNLKPVRLNLRNRHSRQARHLSRMRRDHDSASVSAQLPCLWAGKRIQRVRIENQWQLRQSPSTPPALSRTPRSPHSAKFPAQSRPRSSDHATAPARRISLRADRSLRSFRQRIGHQLRMKACDRRQHGLRRSHG